MEANDSPSLTALQRMVPNELVQAYKADPNRRAIHVEMKKFLRFQLGFHDFLENANLFIAADPGNRPVSPPHKLKPPFTWHLAFDQYMRPKAKGGHREELSAEQWGLLLERHHWYFGGCIQGVRDKIPSDFLTQLCYENPKCLFKYRDAGAFVVSEVKNQKEYHKRKQCEAFIDSAVVFDIEVRGKSGIVEICYWKDGEPETWKKQDATDSNSFLEGMAEYANGRWLVGHNILGWDLPKLREKMGKDFLGECPVWDTMVMQSLLEPWLVSQALTESHEEDQNEAPAKASGGNAHEAEADVEVTRKLFRRQVEAMQKLLDYKELFENAPDPEAFVQHACKKLQEDRNETRKCPSPPSFLLNVPQGKEAVLLPKIMLPLVHWLPKISFDIQIRENQIGKNRQDELIQQSGPYQISNTIAEAVARNLISYASAIDVDLLVEMLPAWTRKAAQRLALDEVNQAAQTSQNEPAFLTIGTYEGMNHPFDWALAHEPFLQLRQACLLRHVAYIIEPAFIRRVNVERFMGCQIAEVPESERANVAPNELHESRLWVDYHPARRIVANSEPWRVWNPSLSARSVPSQTESTRKHSSKHGKLRFPKIIRGDEALSILSPETPKRFEYWSCVVSMVQGILNSTQEKNEAIVHIVLLNEHAELSVAEKIFAEIDYAPGYGRSDFQLLNSLKRQTGGKCLIGRLGDAVRWRQFGERCGVRVEFIIPEIPMNEWAMAISKKCEDEGHDEKSGHSEALVGSQEADEPEDQEEGVPITASDSANEDGEEGNQDHSPKSVIRRLGSQDLQEALIQVLEPWTNMLFPDNQPWILDPRVPVGGPTGLTLIEEIKIERFLKGEEIVKRFSNELGAREPRPPIHTVDHYDSLAKRNWPDWEGFREKTQLPAIQTIVESSKDVFVGLPTGEGKSVLFQIPALEEGMASGKLSIVISPLRALMKDQVASLHKKGYVFSADYLSSDLDRWGIAEAHQRIIDGTTTLLYVAPERFRNAKFLDAIRRRHDSDKGFGFIVLDEAHCFWLWGNEFRPDYFHAVGYLRKDYRDQGPGFRFLLFSATVTESVLMHVRTKLGHSVDGQDGLEVSPKDRLHPVRDFLSLVPKMRTSGGNYRDRLEDRAGKMVELIEHKKINPKDSLVLVFVSMKRQAEECAEILGEKLENWTTEAFHGGLSSSERERIYQGLKQKKRTTGLLATTKAFGMGMDIDDIHRCFHLSPPCYLEDYLQEVGRCGRHEKKRKDAGHEKIECTVFWDEKDLERNSELVLRNSLLFENLNAIHKFIIHPDNSYYSEVDKEHKLALVFPQKDSDGKWLPAIHSALGWLERDPLERIQIVQTLPHILELEVRENIGDKSADGVKLSETSSGVIVLLKQILSIGKAVSENRFIGLLLSESEKDKPGFRRMILSVPGLFREAGLGSLGQAYDILGYLINKDLISIDRDLEFHFGKEAEADRLLSSGKAYLKQLADSVKTGIITRNWVDLVAGAEKSIEKPTSDTEDDSTETNWMARRVAKAILNSTRAAGLRGKESHNVQDGVVFTLQLHSQTRTKETLNWNAVWKCAEQLLSDFQGVKEKGVLPWNMIVSRSSEDGGWEIVQGGMRVLRDLGIVHFDQAIGADSYLVKILSDAPLVDSEGVPADARVEQVKLDLVENNEFNRLRELSMQLWLQIDDKTISETVGNQNADDQVSETGEIQRKKFVDDYFKAKDSKSLEEILKYWALNLKDASGALKSFYEKIQQESVDVALKALEDGEEPQQHAACILTYKRDLLVNAGPGSGKTKVLITRAAHLIQGQGRHPEQILILAFNRAVVSEIKRRVRDLFVNMGYGGYVRKLKVYTFHSFAIKHMENEWNIIKRSKEPKPLERLMKQFINRIKIDDNFVSLVSKDVETILVDEFQDMNEDFFELLKRLKDISGASIMAIGDDDQDILRWNRDGANAPGATDYFKRFSTDLCKGVTPVTHDLKVNFRSCPEIVYASQELLVKNLGSERQKWNIRLEPKSDATTGMIDEFSTWKEGIDKALEEFSSGGSCAVLCRTNAEAVRAYVELKNQLPGNESSIRLLGGADLELKSLRHIAEFIDEAKADPKLGNSILDGANEKLNDVYKKILIPKKKNPLELPLGLLRTAFLVENPNSLVKDWIEWLSQLRISEAERILAKMKSGATEVNDSLPGLTVSTIHKVKGLQFDTVVMMPSKAKFRFSDARDNSVEAVIDPNEDLAISSNPDEIRLYYVGMTRAKSKLFKGIGPREKCLFDGNELPGSEEASTAAVLAGFPWEVYIDWPAIYNDPEKKQSFLRCKLEVGQVLRLERNSDKVRFSIKIGNDTIGMLSENATENLRHEIVDDMDIRVASVFRRPYDSEKNRDDPTKGKVFPKSVKSQKWFYTFLVRAVPNAK